MDSFEIVKPWNGYHIQYALFDFDGTISLIREGWQDVMIPYFCEVMRSTGTEESDKDIEACVTEFVDRLTGKQTIYQCMALDDAVIARGGKKCDPFIYKKEYLRRLEERICSRKEALAQGAPKDDFLVPGIRQFIYTLQANGIKCYLASGTDEPDVKKEAALLGLDDCFAGGIHGAKDNMVGCTKELVIHNMLEEEKIKPEELVSFGDGYVEIELVANIGGLAVGVASDEKRREGINSKKRARLISGGASAIIPDFKQAEEILQMITSDCQR